jgi:fucose 4-O-acetylase-like acetyltransferase
MKPLKRELWIDYAKCISIFLVVLFHTNPHLEGFLLDCLQLLRMPAFFLIAGLLFNIDKWNRFSDFCAHRFKRLIVPYCWFTLLFYALWLIVGRKMVGGEELAIGLWVPIKEFVLGQPKVVLGPYWFITCLFSMQILYYVLKKWLRSTIAIILLSVSSYLLLLYLGWQELPWCLDKAVLFLPFYAYANILREKTESVLFTHKVYPILLALLAIALLMLKNQLADSPYLQHILYIVSGFSIMPGYIVCCQYLASVMHTPRVQKIIPYIGDNNIITLALQNYIIGFIKIVGVTLLATNVLTTDYYILNILIALVTIALSMGIAYLIQRYAPFIIGKTKRPSAPQP